MERRVVLTVMALAAIFAAGVYVVLAVAHLEVRLVFSGPDRRPIAGSWFDKAAAVFMLTLVVGGGVGTLIWWSYKFVRARLSRRGPWS